MLLHRFAVCVAAATALLIFAGGLVTSTGSGLSVPDWPNTYGWFMFTFPLDKMVGGIYYEHGHRLIASTVGLLIVVLAAWLWRVEPRTWVRRLGFLALAAVIAQGILGGITVLWFLPDPISIAHAGLAQLVFCVTMAIALFTSAGWTNGYAGHRAAHDEDRLLQKLAIATTAWLYVQILIGATMRHTEAGLAIPDFPLAFGQLVPPRWDGGIAIHFVHRVGAVIATILAAATVARVLARHRRRRELSRPAVLLSAVLLIQVTLGGLTVLSHKQYIINSLHVVTGAVLLATSLVLTLRAHRARFEIGIASSIHHAAVAEAVPPGPRIADFFALTKPRLNLLVLISTLAGLYLAAPSGVPLPILLHTVVGTALVAGGAAALNQVLERDTDRLMRRTAGRPIPDARLRASDGTWFGLLLSIVGLAELATGVNALSALVAAITLVSYVFVYTPLKRRTSLSTIVGAVPGALPPVIGWVAAGAPIALPAFALFGIVFFWQMPHFLAIAWLYRDDYARAGIPLLPVLEPDGRRTGHQALLYAAALWPVSLMPAAVGLAGMPYSIVATALGFVLIALSALFARNRTVPAARRLFLFSITYLPVLWGALVIDRLWL